MRFVLIVVLVAVAIPAGIVGGLLLAVAWTLRSIFRTGRCDYGSDWQH